MSPITWQNGTAGGTRLNAANLNLVEADISNAQTTATNAQTAANTAQTAANNAQSTANAALPRWAPSTAYTTGQKVAAPNGDIVSAIAAFTSGASYDATKWKPSVSFKDGGRATAALYGTADNITAGGYTYSVWSGADATALGLPLATAGLVRVFDLAGNGATLLQEFEGWTSSRKVVYSRRRISGAWSAWTADATSDTDVAALINNGASATYAALAPHFGSAGTKFAPFALSAGNSSVVETVTDRSFRTVFALGATAKLRRIHIQNLNPRYGNKYAGALSFKGLGLVQHAGGFNPTNEGQFSGTITNLAPGAFTTPTDGSDWVSADLNIPLLPGIEYLITGGYTCASQNNFTGVSGGWVTANSADWNATNPSGLTLTQTAPLFIWLELEIDSRIGVVQYVTDSLGSGVSSRQGLHTSAAYKHARRLGHIPMHYGDSGATCQKKSDPTDGSWRRFNAAVNTLTKPDGSIIQCLSNDVFNGLDLATIQGYFTAVRNYVASNFTQNIGLLTVLPRYDAAAAAETIRKQINTWLMTTLPLNAVVVVDAAGALTNTDGSTINTTYTASPTDIHLTAAGYSLYQEKWPAMHG